MMTQYKHIVDYLYWKKGKNWFKYANLSLSFNCVEFDMLFLLLHLGKFYSIPFFAFIIQDAIVRINNCTRKSKISIFFEFANYNNLLSNEN